MRLKALAIVVSALFLATTRAPARASEAGELRRAVVLIAERVENGSPVTQHPVAAAVANALAAKKIALIDSTAVRIQLGDVDLSQVDADKLRELLAGKAELAILGTVVSSMAGKAGYTAMWFRARADLRIIDLTSGEVLQSVTDEERSKVPGDADGAGRKALEAVAEVVAAKVASVVVQRQQDSVQARVSGKARAPKSMFVVSEEFTDARGVTTKVAQPALQALLEDALLARGFDLVAREQVARIRAEERQVFAEILSDDNAAAKLAMQYGAEYLINASATIRDTGGNPDRPSERHGYAELSLKAINASSGAVIASFKQGGTSPRDCCLSADLRMKSISFLAPPIIENLVTRVLDSWDRELQHGVRYSVKIVGVKSFRQQGAACLRLLERLPDVKQVNQISFGGERLEIEVFFPSERDVSQLESTVINAAAKTKELKRLDVVYTRGRELNFKL